MSNEVPGPRITINGADFPCWECPDLKARISALEDLVREAEWVVSTRDHYTECPWCEGINPMREHSADPRLRKRYGIGHTKDCKADALVFSRGKK